MLNSWSQRRVGAALVLGVPLIGCSSDCVYYPCPLAFGIELTVTASNTNKPPAGLAIGSPGAEPSTMVCDTAGLCRIPAQLGTYHLVVMAPGYASQQIEVNVTGDSPGCNTCGHVDVQKRSIVLTPT